MARRRMFSLSVVDTDLFMDMPTSAQALYFHLGMHGDDDGFVASPRKIARATGCNIDDIRLLISKGYIIQYESGVIVITDWNINNTLKNDRYKQTIYQSEKKQLYQDQSGRYQLLKTGSMPDDPQMVPDCFQTGSILETQHNRTEHNLTEHNFEDKADKPPTRVRFCPPSVEDVRTYCKEQGYAAVDPQRFVDYYASNGWMVGKNKMKDWKAAVRGWNSRESEKAAPPAQKKRLPFPEVPTL